MANKALWEVLDNYTAPAEEFNYDEFIEYLNDVLGDEYEVDIWDRDDFSGGELATDIVKWINDTAKDKIVKDLQAGTWLTSDNEKCFTVIVLKTEGV